MRGFRAAVALAAALSGCSAADGGSLERMPGARLRTLEGPAGPSLASCPTDKCLTVVVAPWCGVCRAEAPNIAQFRRYLAAAGIGNRVVVGLSSDRAAIARFAAGFGPDALLDPSYTLRPRGVPAFFVSDREGRVLKEVDGFPAVDGPRPLAHALGLD